MNERIKQLAEQATTIVDMVGPQGYTSSYANFDREKFAELIVRECMKESMDEIVADEDIAQENDPLIREYLNGNNQGIVDAVVRFRNHFGVSNNVE
jgi:hypothetical protein